MPEDVVPDLYQLAFIPGCFRCPLCNFNLTVTCINANTGEFGTREEDRQTRECDNDGTMMVPVTYRERLQDVSDRLGEMMRLLNTPEIEDFDKAVPLEAAHQVQRWGAEHDEGKNPEDWFWLLGYLAGKALHSAKSGDAEKAKHHCISTAAALRNWHSHLRSGVTVMRPGIAQP